MELNASQMMSSMQIDLLVSGTDEQKIKVIRELLAQAVVIDDQAGTSHKLNEFINIDYIKYGKADSNDFEESLKGWISTTHLESGKRKDKWKKTLAPYVAAYLASLETDLTVAQFESKFGIRVDSSSYSNWTSNYFYRDSNCIHEGFTYTKTELKYWWKKFNLSEHEMSELIDSLQNDGLL